MQRCVHEFTKARMDGRYRGWERTVSLGTSRGSQPCPQVDFQRPELQGRETQPQETGQRAGSCKDAGDPSNIAWHPAQPPSQCSPSRPATPSCTPRISGRLGPLAGGDQGSRRFPRARHRAVQVLMKPLRHQARCWALSQCPLNQTGRSSEGEHDLLVPTQLHGPGCPHGPRPRGHPLHPWGTAPRAVSPEPRSCGRRGAGRWHLLSEEVFVFPLADSKRVP